MSVVYSGWSLSKGLRHAERFFKGARGEERVSGILTRLPESYHVFNDFVAGGKHVDHVVAGPAGVFAVETKYWRGAVTVEDGHVLLDGQLPDRDPLAQALKEAMAAYTKRDRKRLPDMDVAEKIYAEFQERLQICRDIFHKYDYRGFLAGSPKEREQLTLSGSAS